MFGLNPLVYLIEAMRSGDLHEAPRVMPNPPRGKGKVMYRLNDPHVKPPVKSKSLKRLLKQRGRK
jgi:hypothetical protein